MSKRLNIPDDWDGETWICYQFRFPNSLQWQALYWGCVTQFARGRLWNEESGIITDAQAVGREIIERNTPIMTCEDNFVREISIDCENSKLVVEYASGFIANLSIDCLLPTFVTNVFVDKDNKVLSVTYSDEGVVEFDLNSWFEWLVTRVYPDCNTQELVVNFVNLVESRFDLSCLCAGACGDSEKWNTPSTISPQPGVCDIAYNAAMIYLKNMRDAIAYELDNSGTQQTLAAVMADFAAIVGTAPAPGVFQWYTALISGLTGTQFSALVTDTDLNNFGCAFYCVLLVSPDSTKEQYLRMKAFIDGAYPSPENLTHGFFYSVMQVVGMNGLANAVVNYQIVNNDCSACVCACLMQSGGAAYNTSTSYVAMVDTDRWLVGTGMDTDLNGDCVASMRRQEMGLWRVDAITEELGEIFLYAYKSTPAGPWETTDNTADFVGDWLYELAIVADEHTGGAIYFDTTCQNEWCHLFDFSVSDGGFVADGSGEYSGGAWVGTCGDNSVKVRLQRDFSDTLITSVAVIYTAVVTDPPATRRIILKLDGLDVDALSEAVIETGTHTIALETGDIADQLLVRLWASGSSCAGASVSISQIEVCGEGVNPFV